MCHNGAKNGQCSTKSGAKTADFSTKVAPQSKWQKNKRCVTMVPKRPKVVPQDVLKMPILAPKWHI